jgi:hypothetical protein
LSGEEESAPYKTSAEALERMDGDRMHGDITDASLDSLAVLETELNTRAAKLAIPDLFAVCGLILSLLLASFLDWRFLLAAAFCFWLIVRLPLAEINEDLDRIRNRREYLLAASDTRAAFLILRSFSNPRMNIATPVPTLAESDPWVQGATMLTELAAACSRFGRLIAIGTEIAHHDGAVKAQSRLRTIPGDELVNSVFIASTGMCRRQHIEHGRLRLF